MRSIVLRNSVIGFTAGLLVAAFLLSASSRMRSNLAKRDSIAYWAAGKLLLQHQDPYDAVGVLRLERSEGYSEAKPLILRTPPWSIFMVAGLGLANAFTAWTFWIALLLASLIVSVRLCWRTYGEQRRLPAVFVMAAYLFAPVPACLVAGQMGLVLLLGIVLFFWLEQTRPMQAGAALLLPFAKPHLTALFWLILLVWIIDQKKGRIAAGFWLSLTAAICFPLLFDPAIFAHYRRMLVDAAVGHEFIPAFSGVVRMLFFRKMFWVQLIPLVVGLLWAVYFYRKHRSAWNWRQHGPALLIVSVVATPYAWLTDEAVVLPAILQAVMWVYLQRTRLWVRSKLIVGMFIALNALLLLILHAKVPFSTGIYFWSSLVWLAWYYYARSLRRDGQQAM